MKVDWQKVREEAETNARKLEENVKRKDGHVLVPWEEVPQPPGSVRSRTFAKGEKICKRCAWAKDSLPPRCAGRIVLTHDRSLMPY